MISDSEISIRPGTCCSVNARILEMRLNAEYEATSTRAGGGELKKFDYRFTCQQCHYDFTGYVVCNHMDWPPLAEYLDHKRDRVVPVARMNNTFRSLNL